MTIELKVIICGIAFVLFYLYLWYDIRNTRKELEERINGAIAIMEHVTKMNDEVLKTDREELTLFQEKWAKIVSEVDQIEKTFDAYVANTDKRIESLCKASSLYEQEYEQKCNDLIKEVTSSFATFRDHVDELDKRLNECERILATPTVQKLILQEYYIPTEERILN